MTAQIISFAEKRDAIRLKRDNQSAVGFLLPGVIFCSVFWICVGAASVRFWHGMIAP